MVSCLIQSSEVSDKAFQRVCEMVDATRVAGLNVNHSREMRWNREVAILA